MGRVSLDFLGCDNAIIGQKAYVTGVKYLPGGSLIVTNAGLNH